MSTTTDSMSIASVEAITSVEATASVETYTPIYCTDRKCSDILHMCQFPGCHKFMCKSCVITNDAYVYLSKNNLLKMICEDCLPRIYNNKPKPNRLYETSVDSKSNLRRRTGSIFVV
jgi:hypothetical protein